MIYIGQDGKNENRLRCPCIYLCKQGLPCRRVIAVKGGTIHLDDFHFRYWSDFLNQTYPFITRYVSDLVDFQGALLSSDCLARYTVSRAAEEVPHGLMKIKNVANDDKFSIFEDGESDDGLVEHDVMSEDGEGNTGFDDVLVAHGVPSSKDCGSVLSLSHLQGKDLSSIPFDVQFNEFNTKSKLYFCSKF